MMAILLIVSAVLLIGADLLIGTRLFNLKDRGVRASFVEGLGLDPSRVCDDQVVRKGFLLPVLTYREFVFNSQGEKERGEDGYLKTGPRVKLI